MDDDADVFAGFASAEIQLIAVPERDAAIKGAGFVLAQIRLILSELGCALRAGFGEHEIELELDVFVLVDRGQAGASLTFSRRRARDHAIVDLPPALRRIGRWRRRRGRRSRRAGAAASAAADRRPTRKILPVEQRLPGT